MIFDLYLERILNWAFPRIGDSLTGLVPPNVYGWMTFRKHIYRQNYFRVVCVFN